MLEERVDKIIQKNRIDAIYIKNGICMNWEEMCQDFARDFEGIVDGMKVAVYPGGNIGRQIVDSLLSFEKHVECIIDNHPKMKEYKGIPVITYDEWLNENYFDMVLICSEFMSEGFENQLTLDGYRGKILDVYGYLKDTYHNLKIISKSSLFKRWDYMSINQIELIYANASGKEKEEILKAFIYVLFRARDFHYAESYIEELKEHDEYLRYRKAIDEIRSEISQVVNKKADNVWFIHIIDSLADYSVEKMPSLKKIAEDGIRIKGVTVQYPCTHYALNTMLTGKEVFDIELETAELDWNDSPLLQYLKCETMNITFISPNPDVLRTGKTPEIRKKRCDQISYIMFEGLCTLEAMPRDHLIILHSLKEVHTPFYHIGGGQKLISLGYEKATKNDIYTQSANGRSYVDKQIEWYFPYYNQTGCSYIFMGDHGRSDDATFHSYYGIKKDFGIMNNEGLLPAFIITGMDKGMVIEGMISNTSLPDILLDWLKSGKEHTALNLEEYFREYVFLGTIPAYSPGNVDLYVVRGVYGHYEGFIGIKTKKEIYLCSASGREWYFRPDEYRYRNLAKEDAYMDAKEKCRSLLDGREYPIEIYKLEKFKYHLEMLEKYDRECYEKIMEKLKLLET